MKEKAFVRNARKVGLRSGMYFIRESTGTIESFCYSKETREVVKEVSKVGSYTYAETESAMFLHRHLDAMFKEADVKDVVASARKENR